MTWQCASTDSLVVGEPPCILKAIVGAGYAICVFAQVGDIGGLIHLGPDALNPSFCALDGQLEELTHEFIRRCSTIKDARAQIVGGANMMAMRDGRTQLSVVDQHVKRIKSTLGLHGIRVVQTRLGGTKARVIEMPLPCSLADVTFVSKGRRSRIHRQQVRGDERKTVLNFAKSAAEHVVNMGCIELVRRQERLTAILGSCVGIAIHDPYLGVGGLAHAMLPVFDGRDDLPGKYADKAVRLLVEHLVTNGAQLERLRAGLVGGANVLFRERTSVLAQLGTTNVEVSRRLLAELGIPVEWEDVGGRLGRKIQVSFEDFRLDVKYLDVQGVN